MTADLSYLDAIGGSPFTDAVAAAAFDADVMAQSFAVYGFWQTGIHSIPTHGLLDANEVRTWR
jgi:hypothetical protein